MKIWGNVPGVTGIYNKQKKVNKTNEINNVASKNDVVSISNRAKDYQLAMKHLKDIPDFRSEKVEEYSEKINSGNYDVNGKDIADKILKSVFDKKI